MIELGGIESWSSIGNRDVQAVSFDASVDHDLAVRRGILRRVLEQMGERNRRQTWIDLHLLVHVGIDAKRVSVERGSHMSDSGIDDVGSGHPLAIDANRRGSA